MTRPKQDAEFERLRAEALRVPCPRCGGKAGAACTNYYGGLLKNMNDERPGLHPERMNVVRGLPTSERRTGSPWF